LPQRTGDHLTKIESYDLDLDIDFRKALVQGRVGITLDGARNPLVLDASSFRVNSVSIEGVPAPFLFDEKRSKLKVSGIPRNHSRVEIDYTKQVSDSVIFGLYKSRYGKDYMLATDLEPAEARTVFPCVDEPGYKAVFRLQITTESGLNVIANTPLERTEEAESGRTRFVFQETPRMSTYLLFFALGKFEEKRTTSDGVEVMTATRPGQSQNSELALKVVAEALAGFQRYYGVPYPLKKLHVVALPEYHTGAMENWGAISSRESYALITEGTSFSQKTRGAMSMVHETAHQWFGDLVTMKWWDDLWLNESFATFMGYKMTDRIRPEWEMMSAFLRDETFMALEQDALSTTHPIEAHVKNVHDATHIFDAISYNKGASVLRMLESYVGEEAFRRGVSDYLRRFSFSNASGEDLWQALARASKLPVSKVAREWLTRPGYPVVQVRTTKGGVNLTQRPFRLSGRAPPGLWPIPVTIRADSRNVAVFLDRKRARVKASAGSELLVNAGRMGFYAVLYDKAGYERLAAAFPTLDPKDRAGLMNDLFLFLEAGLVEPALYMRFVSLCGGTPDSITTETVAQQLLLLDSIAWDSPMLRGVYPRFYPPLIEKIGEDRKPGEPEYVGAAREALTSQYANVDHGYAERLAQKFDHYYDLDPNIQGAVAIGYAHASGERAEKPLMEMVKTLQGEVDRAKIYMALCSFRDPEVVEETLDLGISGEVSRSDSAYPLLYGAFNPYVRNVYWGWLTEHYETIREMYGGSQQFYLYMSRVIPVCGASDESKVRRFISGRRLKEGGSSYTRALEHLRIASRLRRRLLR
jgi:tricorn protease interacting factor F2/3